MITTEVNLYINVSLKSEFIYKLISQLYYRSIKLIIVLNNYEEIGELDFNLWNNNLDSFLAHTVWQEDQAFPDNSPIVLTILENLENFNFDYVILNLTTKHINQKAKKIVEIFENNKEDLEKARKSYKFYKDKNFKVNYFNI